MRAGKCIRLSSVLGAAAASLFLTSAGLANEPLPGGTWSRDCVNAAMSGTMLTASCPGANAAMTTSTLDIDTCNPPAQAANQNGRLVCETGVRISAPAETSPASQLATAETPPMQAPLTGIAARPFAGEWDIVTERGDNFRLTVEQNGNAVSGSVPFGNDRLQINGVVGAGEKLTLVWQIGNLAGTGELAVTEDGKKLEGQLQSDGGPIEGGTWIGTRPAGGTAGLPPSGTPSTGASAPSGTAPGPDASPAPAGFQPATVASAVSIRDKPTSKAGESRVVGSLAAGTTVSVRCANRYWCELADGRGFVSASFLRLGTSPGSTAATTGTGAGPAGTGGTTTPRVETPRANAVIRIPTGSGNTIELKIDDIFGSGKHPE